MSAGKEFTRLVEIMHRLRSDCPWDRSQSHESLRPYLLEETYEVLHALDARSYEDLREELGDLMLQVVFHAELAREAGRFEIEGVLADINEKLVRRHPHVFGEAQADSPVEVLRRWEGIKGQERPGASALDGVPAELPALVKAVRVMSKMRQAGVQPFRAGQAAALAAEWLGRLTEAVEKQDPAAGARACGALLLALAGMSDGIRVNPEDALRQAIGRMAEAFMHEEARLRETGRSLADLNGSDLDQAAARVLAACTEA
jgi:MazG family protein